MWKTTDVGLAQWHDGHGEWTVDARGGQHGIGLLAGADRFASFCSVDEAKLPLAAEQFVAGNRLRVNCPQGDRSFALRLAFEPIEVADDFLAIEVTVAIQTDLLDSHPQIDIESDCLDIDSYVPSDPSGDNEVQASGSAPISIAKRKDHHVGVLLGPHDSPFTTNHSTDMLLRLRLFGDFLEKGVIRKARPWLVIDRSGHPPDTDRLESLWQQLTGSPLPLTP